MFIVWKLGLNDLSDSASEAIILFPSFAHKIQDGDRLRILVKFFESSSCMVVEEIGNRGLRGLQWS